MKVIPSLALCLITLSAYAQHPNPIDHKNNTAKKNTAIMNESKKVNSSDNSNKSILARGCDPVMSLSASKAIPLAIGNPAYIPTTNDADFVKKLKSRKWSVIFFAPGACRYSAAKHAIPGGNSATAGWTLDQYRALVYELQGDEVQIVETIDELETVGLLKMALEKARITN
jgi:hypothetical protein